MEIVISLILHTVEYANVFVSLIKTKDLECDHMIFIIPVNVMHKGLIIEAQFTKVEQ